MKSETKVRNFVNFVQCDAYLIGDIDMFCKNENNL